MARDPFIPEDGNEFDGSAVIQEAWYEHDEDNNRTLLKFTMYSEDPDVGEFVKQYGCGKGWLIEDDGARVVHESKKSSKTFHVKSGVGTLLKSCNDHGIDLRTRGYTPFEAGLWKGLDAEWETVKDEFDIDGETKTRSIPVPVAVNGNGTVTPIRKATAKKADTTSAVDGALRGKLLILAKQCATHDEFMEKAFTTVDGVVGTEAEAVVMDEAGLYAEAHA